MKNLEIIKNLEEEILRHRTLYYQGLAQISDEQFDALEDTLRDLDPENPILFLVGSPIDQSKDKVKHRSKMLSLEKAYEIESLQKWSFGKDTISLLKIDGSSCSLIYQNGHLAIGKTRGDGEYGENISAKCLYIKSIPKTLNIDKEIEVRGEVYCREEDFAHLSQEMKRRGLNPPTALRNIVAGILGRKEHIDLARYLRFAAFDIITEEVKFKEESEKLLYLKKIGFSGIDFLKHQAGENFEEIINKYKIQMNDLDYLTDGIVFTFNNIQDQLESGFTNHHPKFKMAFKFKGESQSTKILDIEWNVSRNGICTPVGLIQTINLSGADVSRVTFHNFGLVKSFDLKSGDIIEVVRSGEVIPKFLGVIQSSDHKFSYPKNCPSCGSSLSIDNIWLCCKNRNCPAKIKESILHFIKTLGVEDLSDKRLDELIKTGLVKSIPDIYRIKKEDLLKVDKTKEKLADKILSNIDKSKSPSLQTFIAALGIEGISIAKCEKIMSHGYDSLEKLLMITYDDLIKVDSFAAKSAQDFIEGIESRKLLIQDLLDLGFSVREEKIVKENILNQAKICITGELSTPRGNIEKLIKEFGGIVSSGVSKNTNFLLTNETEGQSSKFLKAIALSVKIISEKEFYKMIGK